MLCTGLHRRQLHFSPTRDISTSWTAPLGLVSPPVPQLSCEQPLLWTLVVPPSRVGQSHTRVSRAQTLHPSSRDAPSLLLPREVSRGTQDLPPQGLLRASRAELLYDPTEFLPQHPMNGFVSASCRPGKSAFFPICFSSQGSRELVGGPTARIQSVGSSVPRASLGPVSCAHHLGLRRPSSG